MLPNACRDIIAAHVHDVETAHGADYPAWKRRHIAAWNYPQTDGEVAVKQALRAYAAMADGYTADVSDDDGGIGRDGYFGDHALGLLKAVNAWLSMGVKSRLDNGAILRLIHQLAVASGVNPDDV